METIPVLGFYEPFSSWSHLAAAIGFLLAGLLLIKKGRGSGLRMSSLIIYTFALVYLFSMSGVFHLLPPGTARNVLQRLDHTGIWILIAGTFTPIHVILFRRGWRWIVLGAVWIVAITGLTLEVVFFHEFPQSLILSLFLGLGWTGALTGYKFRASFQGESLKLMVLGGISYSFGGLIDFINWPVLWPGFLGPHEVFHVLVVIGAVLFWRFIYEWADHPVANVIVFRVSVFPHNHCVAESTNDNIKVEASSLDDLKDKIKKAVRHKYHESILPEIHLTYFQEEKLYLR
jgi:channel protein (hemolysin III family)